MWVADINAEGAAETARQIEEQEGKREGASATPYAVRFIHGYKHARIYLCIATNTGTDRPHAHDQNLTPLSVSPDSRITQVDLSEEGQVSGMLDAIMARDGRLDVLVNNAARSVRFSFRV